MQLALPADSPNHGTSSGHSPTDRRRTRFLVAGVAMASAGVIAVNPMTPTPPAFPQPSVELAAFVNPITQLQETLAQALTQTTAVSTGAVGSSTALAQALANPALFSELATFVGGNALNPSALLTQLANFGATYGDRINAASAASNTALQTALGNLPTILQNTIGYLQSGQFVEAFSEVNIYFLVQLLERPAVPLFPLFPIPGDVLSALPGGQIPAALLDSLLVRGQASGLARALLAPAITATLQVAEILDKVQVSLKAGDTETAVSDLINLPVKALNAFVNGYVPNFPTRSTFQGLLSPNGPVDYFLVDLPTAIAKALTPPAVAVTAVATPTTPTTPTPSTFARVSSTEIAPASELVTLSRDTTPATTETASTPSVESAAAASDTTPAVAASTTPAHDGDVAKATTAEPKTTSPAAESSTAGADADEKSDTKTDPKSSAEKKTDSDTKSGGSTSDSGKSGGSTSGDSSGGSGSSGSSGSSE